ncbi:HAD family hydrolase [Trueperella bialowiezensis]|uniref:Phosphorylated carbohydrates phosphatase TM_1254 n=1 Tax=Trueperella bialowiezensis TaxID=312285 RepID=A0A3S4UXM4_9ACTO|nr:HAD family phosphatase [Trueperella bialowiezensis]VEI12374.1 Phosphorylated carbohydrates phosphatase TM_1254 [Trueperella bialowiezensis]
MHFLESTSRQLPDAVLVDMDGTLTDTEKLWFQAEIDVMADFGREWKSGDETELIGMNLHDSSHYLVRKLDLDVEPAEFGRILTDRVAQLAAEHGAPWRPGARELLELLSALGIPSVLVTASMRNLAQFTLDQAPAGSLEYCVSGEDVSAGKPDPEPYLRAASLVGADPSRCIAFEDSIPGLTSAISSGAVTYGVPLNIDISHVRGATIIDSLEVVNEEFLHTALARR